jgi:putative phosphoesterase
MQRVGLISDTHRLLREQAVDFLRGSDLILHAGDFVTPDALHALRTLAPVVAVRGNNDQGDWADELPAHCTVEVAGIRLHVVHDIAELAIDPAAQGVHVVISGHSHRPRIETRGGVLYVNPGSAGPRRFSLPVSVGELLIGGEARVAPRLVTLDV